jgi:hypothetical protein
MTRTSHTYVLWLEDVVKSILKEREEKGAHFFSKIKSISKDTYYYPYNILEWVERAKLEEIFLKNRN